MTAQSRPIAPALPPHVVAYRWARANLFSSPGNAVLTIVTVAILGLAAYQGSRFVFATAEWEIIEANRGLFFTGRFPRDEFWRIWVTLHGVAVLFGLSWRLWGTLSWRLPLVFAAACVPLYVFMLEGWAILWTSTSIAAFAAAYFAAWPVRFSRFRDLARNLTVWLWILGFAAAMLPTALYPSFLPGQGGLFSHVPDREWGGLFLTMVLAIVGIAVSFPLGVLLAVGRASTFPVIRIFCVAYIEMVRAVPLITILFMSFFILRLAIRHETSILGIPITGYEVSVVFMAMLGFVLFSAAYIAEIVRGGLQAVPRGQIEAGQALGLGGVQVLALIVLPQALRAVIPALVSQFISLFKDTSLVFILALTDLLAVSRIAPAQPGFIGLHAEALLFIGLIYWVIAFSMSRASQQLERNLGVGER
ncbi:MAG: amino acid ABC transporter permease [Chloroflexi bacterium]|nr:amino acid ABC transporter permease [Chloroflexota bacterium]